MKRTVLSMFLLLMAAAAAWGAINVPSDGSDGILNVTTGIQIDLSQAVTGTWDQPGNGKGVYDPEKWAIVFKYQSVNITSTVTFKNHPSYAPVVWLVQGNVSISGTLSLSGEGDVLGRRKTAEPGPGGFRGGYSGCTSQPSGSGGFGPGGGGLGSEGSYATIGGGGGGPVYGNAEVLPLIGGSGGASTSSGSRSGGAGGGDILIGAGGNVAVNGSIHASGGSSSSAGDGAGGAVRIVADTINGNGWIYASPGYYGSGDGRVRIEANSSPFEFGSTPAYSFATVGTDAQIWPDNPPRVKAVSLGGQPVPTEPRVDLTFPNTDLTFTSPGNQTLVIDTENVPLSWHVRARLIPASGQPSVIDAVHVSGDEAQSTWQATISLGMYFSVIQVLASQE